MNTKQILPVFAVVALAAGALSFFGGMQYGKHSALSDLQPEQMRAAFQRTGANISGQSGSFRQGAMVNRANAVMGEVLSKDEQSMTVKLPDGGSKIVFFSEQTEINKTATGALADLQVGTSIVANGTPNQDGSMTAKTIQLRPNGLPIREGK